MMQRLDILSARSVHNQARSWIGFRDTPMGALGEVDDEALQISPGRGSGRPS